MRSTRSGTGAQRVCWNLKDLFTSRTDLRKVLEESARKAGQLASRYHGRLRSLPAPGWAAALRRLERLHDRLGRAYTYAYLDWCAGTGNARKGALLQEVREKSAQIEKTILFLELEWARLPRRRAEALLRNGRLARYRHYLELLQRQKPYLLTEAEEKILAEKGVTGRQAWNRFFDETLGAMRFDFRRRQLTEQEILAKLYHPDRQIRRQAARVFTKGLQSHLRELTYLFNTLLADKFADDRLRGYPHWLSARNMSNEIPDQTVEVLIRSVTRRYDLVARYYRLKRRLLGVRQLFDYDRYAPLEKTGTAYRWRQARDLVLEAYHSFHPELASVAGRFFKQRWIDAALRPGKMGGAFSHGSVPSAHPYILLNYTGTIRDVQTLAHELGHGVHQYLARRQGLFHAHTPLTMAETASVFGERLVFDLIMQKERSPRARLSMLMNKIDDSMATVFRQVAMNRFEDRIHGQRRSQGELSSEDFSNLWMKTQEEMFQGSVRFGNHYRIWWSYIPHFLHSPGYVYAYAFGELLVLALHARYREEGAPFAERYLDLLRAGGSAGPQELLRPLKVDLDDEGFWELGLQSIEALIEQAERLAA